MGLSIGTVVPIAVLGAGPFGRGARCVVLGSGSFGVTRAPCRSDARGRKPSSFLVGLVRILRPSGHLPVAPTVFHGHKVVVLFGVPPVLFGGAILGVGASDGGGALSVAVLGPLRSGLVLLDLRSSRIGRRGRFRLRLVLFAEFAAPLQHPGADGLSVMGSVDDFLGMFFEGLDPASDIGGSVPGIMPDAEFSVGHHRADLGPELLAGVALRPRARLYGVLETLPVHPVGVTGGVSDLMESGAVVAPGVSELLTGRHHDAVLVELVEGAVAAFVPEIDAAGADHALGGVVSFPSSAWPGGARSG